MDAGGRSIERPGLPRRMLKWFGLLIAALLALILAALAVLHIASERHLGRERLFAGAPVAVPTDARSLAEGERWAHITGCTGCHRPDLGGGVFFDAGWLIARLVAPNLTTIFRDHSEVDIERAVRKGIGVDGRTLVAMPSAMYRSLSDEHLGQIFAYAKSLPLVERDLPETRLGPMARFLILNGELELDADVVARLGPGNSSPDFGNPDKLGAYLVHVACTECHGHDLGGSLGTPHLGIARAYTLEQFGHLMKTGEAIGGREVGLMT